MTGPTLRQLAALYGVTVEGGELPGYYSVRKGRRFLGSINRERRPRRYRVFPMAPLLHYRHHCDTLHEALADLIRLTRTRPVRRP